MPDPRETQAYCVADRHFYETPSRLADEADRYPLSLSEAPPGWRRSGRGLWTSLIPVGVQPAEQGWKIHVSATPETAEATLDTAARICLARGVPFKFLRSTSALLFVTGKNMSRSSSGKFVTVYPEDDERFRELVAELAAALDGNPGPYILSDLRIGPGPVHVRYGAFLEQWCPGDDGLPVLALRKPSGELVPDDRGPVFRIPEWVDVPPMLEPHLSARRAAKDDDFPYVISKALHFSNAGGIYLAEHRDTGERVVLREARPYSGLDGTGSDAVERLHREYRALTKLKGLDCVPQVYGVRTVWEHHFLIEEYIEGERLLEAVVSRYPLVRHLEPSEEQTTAYVRWVATVTGGLVGALDALHRRGLSFRDLHPGNVMVRPDDSVVLVDFEYAADLTDRGLPPVGAAGFVAPAGAEGAEADQHALWATWLMMLMPMVEMVQRDPAKAATLEAFARERFRLSPEDGPRKPVIRRLSSTPDTPDAAPADLFADPAANWQAIRDRLVAGIHACATPEREDRLFPGDPAVFGTGGFTLAHGAAGVLHALHRAGVPVPAEYSAWLVASARRSRPASLRGLYDGLHGVATVLDELGLRDEALELLSRAGEAGEPMRAGLFGGRAGVALNQCHFAVRTGDEALLDSASRTADRLDALLRDGSQEGLVLPASAGLMHGLSGAALLHLRLYRITGEKRRLAAARAALDWELGHCVPMPDGTVQVKDGHRHLLYLDGGSGGVALAAREYLAHADDARLASFVASVRRGCAYEFVREPGLFRGRSGLIAVQRLLDGPEAAEDALPSVRRLAWHAVYRDEGMFFPGAGLLRFSADLATGSAGVLLALHGVFEGKGDFLPLLPAG
ncbi:class III lanthionine synthetase LanKC [Streptomyces sp. NBC_01537]|uniref:class III lanthionine synthetase LanKC n=1 Tax=Streptomyces sp. NBC_01537 TaxID=2903896 RepID=UPI0038639CA8